jgi:thioredoxin 1
MHNQQSMKYVLMMFVILLLIACTKDESSQIADQLSIEISPQNSEENHTPINTQTITSPEIQPSSVYPSYVPFDQMKFETAQEQGKVIYLEFYASWCPSCRAQDPAIRSAFEQMKQKQERYQNVAGFQVDYDRFDDLKKKYGITYQHSHIILSPSGDVAVKSIGEQWDAGELINKIDTVLGG